ncbi:MAG: hypothetical protein B6U94_03980 [Thermofilum sp. ex4484_79]|nr:MAG: hypothetical protein B6U94_03980 [Thermofilum sp. ex4484_79]
MVKSMSRGRIGEGKYWLLEGKEYNMETSTEKGLRCIRFAIKMGLDIIAVSYVRDSQDINRVKKEAELLGFDGSY